MSLQIDSIPDQKRLHHKLMDLTGKALCDFQMLEPNDRVLVAVSGGKDSLALLRLLLDRRRATPFPYEVRAIFVDSNFQCGAITEGLTLQELMDKWEVPLEIAPMEIEMKFDQKKMGASCFWCSWNRRKFFFEAADRLGCTKVALGHHKDDLVETGLMNLFFQGRFEGMLPSQSFFEGKFKMIRPLCYIEEDLIRQFAVNKAFPKQSCTCPVGAQSERRKMKLLLQSLERGNNNIKSNIFKALVEGGRLEEVVSEIPKLEPVTN
jgi:tRNA 2-thiocytidine biosynthesis protein TtcA